MRSEHSTVCAWSSGWVPCARQRWLQRCRLCRPCSRPDPIVGPCTQRAEGTQSEACTGFSPSNPDAPSVGFRSAAGEGAHSTPANNSSPVNASSPVDTSGPIEYLRCCIRSICMARCWCC
ncbi:MAG: hypothetical protein FJY39_01480 [Betaproteobacteria bacterium]|nr:hypothetical protein [Betaproteobacteria bacterium]